MMIKDKYAKSDYLEIDKCFDGDYILRVCEQSKETILTLNLGKYQIKKLINYLNEKTNAKSN